ncbi:unnamed protein product [Paramecium sonneborni]|uniref:Uncharacterized protein n=1 Tax=Paramecium sonneborni TaxID=65129 RepID=A0A8S1RMW5_9CILI|nr:unnamed protein product [Paramecium sonneborni]
MCFQFYQETLQLKKLGNRFISKILHIFLKEWIQYLIIVYVSQISLNFNRENNQMRLFLRILFKDQQILQNYQMHLQMKVQEQSDGIIARLAVKDYQMGYYLIKKDCCYVHPEYFLIQKDGQIHQNQKHFYLFSNGSVLFRTFQQKQKLYYLFIQQTCKDIIDPH